MKRYRRIEITAFHRRVVIGSADSNVNPGAPPTLENEADSKVMITGGSAIGQETLIEPGSPEEKEILIEALRLLEERIAASRPGLSQLPGR